MTVIHLKNPKIFKKYFNLLIIIAAGLITEFMAISFIDRTSPEGLERLIFLGSWAITPYLFLIILIMGKGQTDKQINVKLVGTIIIVVFGLLLLKLGAHPNLIGMVLLFGAFWQWVGCVILAVISWIIKKKIKKEQL